MKLVTSHLENHDEVYQMIRTVGLEQEFSFVVGLYGKSQAEREASFLPPERKKTGKGEEITAKKSKL